MERFHCHKSIFKIQKPFHAPDKFYFHGVTEHKVRKEILRLDGTKATPVGNIPARMLKSTIDTHVSVLTKIINLCLRNICFPDHFKAAEVSPTFMTNDDLGRENYRPVSFLPHMSKVFARAMYV